MTHCLVPIYLPFCETDSVVRTTGGIDIYAHFVRLPGICPKCRQLSDRVHGYYERTLVDLPASQFQVRVKLRVRRYRCFSTTCDQQTFSQRIGGFFEPYQRATNRLLTSLYHIAQVAGGEAGARLANKLSMPISDRTLLRLIRRHPETCVAEPRVLGVDDWAMRKGHRYGTILVDLERRHVVDLLPDRTAVTLKAWLQAHGGVELVARDRSMEYALGISQGAPSAVQVADRWHLLKNLSEATERALQELSPRLRKRMSGCRADVSTSRGSLRDNFPRGQSDESARQERRLKRFKRYELIRYLGANGLSQRRIASLVNISRGTVIRYARAETFLERASRSRKPSILDPYLPHLEFCFQAGNHNALQLWNEIIKQGYPGSPSQVRKWMRWRRKQPMERVQETSEPPSALWLLPAAKELTRLLVRKASTMSDHDTWLRERLCTIPEIATVAALVSAFQTMVCDKRPEMFKDWLAQCRKSQIKAFARFAGSLAQDGAAVRAALETSWSNGQTEGQVNRLKLLKRQMYGRANLDLLRRRVLYQA